jgi:hypothetical protein
MELTQTLAEKYLNSPKRLKNKNSLTLNAEFKINGEELISDEYGDIFKLDLRKNKIELQVMNCNTRANECFVLARLCVNDREHKNPDGTKIGETHLHIYKEGYNDRFAYDPKKYGFSNFDNVPALLIQFVEFCKINKRCFNIDEAVNDPRFEKNN